MKPGPCSVSPQARSRSVRVGDTGFEQYPCEDWKPGLAWGKARSLSGGVGGSGFEQFPFEDWKPGLGWAQALSLSGVTPPIKGYHPESAMARCAAGRG